MAMLMRSNFPTATSGAPITDKKWRISILWHKIWILTTFRQKLCGKISIFYLDQILIIQKLWCLAKKSISGKKKIFWQNLLTLSKFSSKNFEYKISSPNWKFKLEVQIGSSNWKFILEIRIGNPNWKFILEIHIGNSYWKSKLEIQIRNSNLKSKLEIQIGNLNWKFKFEIQIGNLNWKSKFEIQIWNPNWKFKFEIQIGNSNWKFIFFLSYPVSRSSILKPHLNFIFRNIQIFC